MNKLLLFLFFTISFLVDYSSVMAQCSFTASASSTESRCKESGSITVTTSVPGLYTYEIVSGPVTIAETTNNIFYNLAAGNYDIKITLSSCSITVSVIVAGTYIEPSLLTATVTNIACPSSFGCIKINEPSNGHTPYQYAIVSGPVTTSFQTNPNFCNLPSGLYKIQALDSCGVVRTADYTIVQDTGDFVAYTYGYDLRFANCDDLIIAPTTGISNTSLHTLLKVWYVKPNGDTLKINELEYPVQIDTLTGEAHTYGTWKMIAYDSCGRIRQSSFMHSAPGFALNNLGQVCGGYQVQVSNQWKYNLSVHYRVLKCSDNSVVYDVVQDPQTTFYSQAFTLNYDTCYKFEHYNECGDTVKGVYNLSKPIFNINACQGPACSVIGKGTITVFQNYLSGVSPITYTIIDGPEGVGTTVSQGQYTSWANFTNLALGDYAVEGVDGCGQKDTVYITLNKPLQRAIEITQVPNCSGGANIHVKVTSNFYNCQQHFPTGAGSLTYVTATNPGYIAKNVVFTNTTSTTPSVWEADYINVTSSTITFSTFANEGCTVDTTINVNAYIQPNLSNVSAYVCNDGTSTINYTISGGSPPYQFRIKPTSSSTWSSWQNNTIFSGISTGLFDIEVRDVCPNGSISSINITRWAPTPIYIDPPCGNIDSTIVFTASPIVGGVDYEWLLNGAVIGTGSTFTIPSFALSDVGTYYLRQKTNFGSCYDSTLLGLFDCATFQLPLHHKNFKGLIVDNRILLSWETLQNDIGYKFTIEHSANGIDFNKVSTLYGGSNNYGAIYKFLHSNIFVRNYYRIKFISIDGKAVFYSTIIIVNKLNDIEKRVALYPNPLNNHTILHYKGLQKSNINISCCNALGKIIWAKQYAVVQGDNIIKLEDQFTFLNSGIYLLKIADGNFMNTIKVIKSK
jgi:hypothetical protein